MGRFTNLHGCCSIKGCARSGNSWKKKQYISRRLIILRSSLAPLKMSPQVCLARCWTRLPHLEGLVSPQAIPFSQPKVFFFSLWSFVSILGRDTASHSIDKWVPELPELWALAVMVGKKDFFFLLATIIFML